METLQKLPIGIQTFQKLRKQGFLYVDKTDLVYQLANSSQFNFLSRPRRFGKSMLISTLEAYFEGDRESFEGLAIEKLETKWTKHPVLHLDLNVADYQTKDTLRNKLSCELSKWEAVYGANPTEKELGDRFAGVICRAYEQTGQLVVILIDEYDKPILETLDNEELQANYRATLKGFYGALKSLDKYIRFCLLTGVTKFSKVSVFSGINNLKDISLSETYATICGITDEDIDTKLMAYVKRIADKNGMTVEQAREELRSRYDGYHFSKNSPGVYNPFSLLNAFDDCEFRNYWFATGTPSYLVHLLKKHHSNLEEVATRECDADVIESTDPQSSDPVPVIYQSGYLTIKDFDPEFRVYTLGFPNKEVEDGFLKYLLPNYTTISPSSTAFNIRNFVKEIQSGRIDDFMRRLSSLFADTPYELVKDLENHYQNVMFIVTKLMGLYVNAEYHTSQGRIDLVLQTSDYVYVMEFKLDGSAEEALAQINEKGYARPFETSGRRLMKVGVNFSATTRNIDRWIIE